MADWIVQPPLLRVEAVRDPVLGQFRPLRGFQGTMAPVPKEIVTRPLQLTESRRVPLDRASASPRDSDVDGAITGHNLTVRQELKAALRELSPTDFELLVAKLLAALGFEVEHTGHSGDGGVDAVALLSLSGLTSVLTRVQAKRWAHSVSSPTVRELRGALKVDERGLIVTTAEFTADAKQEAQAEGKARIGLIERVLEKYPDASDRLKQLPIHPQSDTTPDYRPATQFFWNKIPKDAEVKLGPEIASGGEVLMAEYGCLEARFPEYRRSDRRWLRPAVAADESPPSFLMTWWLILYALSMTARYHPVSWVQSLDVDSPPIAVLLSRCMSEAMEAVPVLVLEAIHDLISDDMNQI